MEGSLPTSASRLCSILLSFSSSLRYQKVCMADSGQCMRVSTCASHPPPFHIQNTNSAINQTSPP
jgi:hypothetical protein